MIRSLRPDPAPGGATGYLWNGAPIAILTTTGETTGRTRKHALIFGTDDDDVLFVASNGGAAEHPQWYDNLTETPAVEVQVQVRDDRYPGLVRTATSEERDRLWPNMTELWPSYDDYQAATDREIPIVIIKRGSTGACHGSGACHDGAVEQARLDRWLWSVRVAKTRAAAKTLCDAGHVRIDGQPAKPSSPVVVGNRIQVRTSDRDRDFEVVQVIEKRVGAPVAVTCYVDHSPPEPDRKVTPPVFERDRGTGRPTKRDRRRLDQHRGR